MFDVGFSELVLIFVIGLLILGPERLPRVAAQIGRWVARARRTANQLRHQLEREMALDDIRNKKPPARPKPTDPKPPDPKPPGDETAGSSHTAAQSPGSGDAPNDADSSPAAAASVASSVPASGAPSAPETARPVGSAPEVDTRVEETTEETSTSNS